MAIWNVTEKSISSLNLLRTSFGNFRVVQYGAFALMLTGSDYTLIHESLISAFELLPSDQLEIRKISITRTSTQKVWSNYIELLIKRHINPEQLKTTDSSGEQIWQFNHALFVSDDLKNKLHALSSGQLECTFGFSHFAG